MKSQSAALREVASQITMANQTADLAAMVRPDEMAVHAALMNDLVAATMPTLENAAADLNARANRILELCQQPSKGGRPND